MRRVCYQFIELRGVGFNTRKFTKLASTIVYISMCTGDQPSIGLFLYHTFENFNLLDVQVYCLQFLTQGHSFLWTLLLNINIY